PLLEEEAKAKQKAGSAAGGKSSAASRRGESKAPEIVPEPWPQSEAREQAAAMTYTNPRYVSDAKKIKEQSPEMLEKARQGGYVARSEKGRPPGTGPSMQYIYRPDVTPPAGLARRGWRRSGDTAAASAGRVRSERGPSPRCPAARRSAPVVRWKVCNACS